MNQQLMPWLTQLTKKNDHKHIKTSPQTTNKKGLYHKWSGKAVFPISLSSILYSLYRKMLSPLSTPILLNRWLNRFLIFLLLKGLQLTSKSWTQTGMYNVLSNERLAEHPTASQSTKTHLSKDVIQILHVNIGWWNTGYIEAVCRPTTNETNLSVLFFHVPIL